MLLYAITDRRRLGSDEQERRHALLRLAAGWARAGVDYLQIREKDLDPGALARLTHDLVRAVRAQSAHTRVLLNGSGDPASIALLRDSGADGIHLGGAAHDVTTVRKRLGSSCLLSVACHSQADLERAAETGADLVLLAPVFEKRLSGEARLTGMGVEAIRRGREALAGKQRPPKLLALGGITMQNARQAVDAGADGIAAIRLFLEEHWTGLRER